MRQSANDRIIERYSSVVAVLLMVAIHGTVTASDEARQAAAIAEQCPAIVSAASIECRAAELGRAMEIASEVGTLNRWFPFIAQKANVAIVDADYQCSLENGHAHAGATGKLRRAMQLLDQLRSRLTKNTRSLDSGDTATGAFLDVIVPLRADIRALRRTLVCPSNLENTCGDGIPKTGFDGGPGGEECDDGNRQDGDGCSAQCLIEPVVTDFSSFTTFEFSRESAFGFCPPVGTLFDAAVTTGAEGVLTLQWSVLRDDAGCADVPFQCADRDEGMRQLTSDEAAQLRDAFRAVEVFETRPNGCESIAFDPCLVNAFHWDEFSGNDFPCRLPLIGDGARLIDALTGLAH